MTTTLKPSSPFAMLFRSRFGLVDHRIAWRRFDQCSFLPSGRFSAWFGRLSRRSQLCHHFGHCSPYLLWRSFPLARLPWAQRGLHLWTRQHQPIMHDSNDLAPAFKWRWGTQPGLCPQQGLRVFAIAMFVRVAPPVAQGHFWQVGVGRSVPQKPTLTRVAGLISRTMAQEADDCHLQVPRLGQMQPCPPGDLDQVSVGIGALPEACP